MVAICTVTSKTSLTHDIVIWLFVQCLLCSLCHDSFDQIDFVIKRHKHIRSRFIHPFTAYCGMPFSGHILCFTIFVVFTEVNVFVLCSLLCTQCSVSRACNVCIICSVQYLRRVIRLLTTAGIIIYRYICVEMQLCPKHVYWLLLSFTCV